MVFPVHSVQNGSWWGEGEKTWPYTLDWFLKFHGSIVVEKTENFTLHCVWDSGSKIFSPISCICVKIRRWKWGRGHPLIRFLQLSLAGVVVGWVGSLQPPSRLVASASWCPVVGAWEELVIWQSSRGILVVTVQYCEFFPGGPGIDLLLQWF